MSVQHYFRALWSGRRRSPDAMVLLPFLGMISIPYAVVLRLRVLAYKLGLIYTKQLPKPVISVGNITVGGTGKTPMVALIARYCIGRGKRVAVLSRGYGGSSQGTPAIVADGRNILMSPAEAGDEPYMLAEKNPGLMVVVGADRYRAGLLALEKLNPDLFILDDGFQHLRLHRDLNILLADHERPLGNGMVLPAGLLRESRSAVKRADLIIYTRCTPDADFDHFPGIPCCHALHDIASVAALPAGKPAPISCLANLRGAAFAGIAEPDSFFSMLEESGLEIVEKLRFPDHCRYGEREISGIVAAAKAINADYLVTTEKDAVKLSAHADRLGRIYSSVLEVKIREMDRLTERLEDLIQR